LSLRDVEHSTRIPVARLQDLEEDRLNTFGGMAYAKSFLRSYSTLLEVDAGEVLNQLKAPPLGGARDYRYLVETQGPWISDRHEWRSNGNTPAALPPGKSALFVTVICLAGCILIGGAVLANAYLNSKTAAAAASQNQAADTAKSSAPDSASASGAYISPGELPTEKSAAVEPNRPFAPEQPAVTKAVPATATGAPAPPKAEPVLEVVRKPLPPPPKAERVR
jgi:cytoskeletal protein RodZ